VVVAVGLTPAVIVRNARPEPRPVAAHCRWFPRPQRPPLRSSMTGGPARSLHLLVEPHQLVHQLLDAADGLRGELLDRRILHRGDIGAEFVPRAATPTGPRGAGPRRPSTKEDPSGPCRHRS
jgi:hypothetical protein